MPQEFEGDLAGAVFWGADLRGARFRDVNLRDVTISHAWLVDVEIDAFVDRLVINGVDVTAFVAARDRWFPLRTVLGAADLDDMLAGWVALGEAWAAIIARARRLPDEQLHASVGGEWSFVETLRHLLFATDKWFTAPLLGRPLHPAGLPNTGSTDFPWPDIDLDTQPPLAEVLAARADQRHASVTTSAPWRPTISRGPSRCWRTVPTWCATASRPCSRRSSGTSATQTGTSPPSKPAGGSDAPGHTVQVTFDAGGPA